MSVSKDRNYIQPAGERETLFRLGLGLGEPFLRPVFQESGVGEEAIPLKLSGEHAATLVELEETVLRWRPRFWLSERSRVWRL